MRSRLSDSSTKKEVAGDVFRINVTPSGHSFPWVRIFRFPYGIRGGKARDCGGVNATKANGRHQTALEIGEAIIANSKILSKWFTE